MPAPTLFTRNVGTADRAIRVILGVVLLTLALTGQTAWGYLGIVPLLTGAIGTCPLYSLLGFSTCPIENS